MFYPFFHFCPFAIALFAQCIITAKKKRAVDLKKSVFWPLQNVQFSLLHTHFVRTSHSFKSFWFIGWNLSVLIGICHLILMVLTVLSSLLLPYYLWWFCRKKIFCFLFDVPRKSGYWSLFTQQIAQRYEKCIIVITS